MYGLTAMNLTYYKQKALARLIGDMMEATCEYSVDTIARWGAMEPEPVKLAEFRLMLADLADAHFYNNLTIDKVTAVDRFVWKTGFEHGHCMGTPGQSTTTGVWGHRHTELKKMMKIIQLPEGDLVRAEEYIKVRDYIYKVVEYNYRINTNAIWVVVKPIDHIQREFEMDFGLAELARPDCAIRAENKYAPDDLATNES